MTEVDYDDLAQRLTHGRELTDLGMTTVKTFDMLGQAGLLPATQEAKMFIRYCRMAGPDGKPAMSPRQFFVDMPHTAARLLRSLSSVKLD